MVGHLLSGAGLGLFLALTTMVGNVSVLNLMINSPAPKLSVLFFAGTLSSIFAVGSAVTGFIFSSLDRD